MAAADKVYYYVYFNGDENWRVLSTNYMDEDSYVFYGNRAGKTETAAAETQAPSANQGGTFRAGVRKPGTSGTGTTSTTTTTTGGLPAAQGRQQRQRRVSTSCLCLRYPGLCGRPGCLLPGGFRLCPCQGLTGNHRNYVLIIQSTRMPRTAEIRISLNTGGTITGTYDKGSNTYRFTGL